MNLCSTNHDEVAHEGLDCPACKLWDETVTLTNDLDGAKDTIKELRDKIYDLEHAAPPSSYQKPYDR